MPKHKSEDYILLTVQHYLEKKDNQIDTCNLFKCSPRSLMRWVRRYKVEQSIKRHNRIPIAYKVKKIHIKFILDEIIKNKTIIDYNTANMINITSTTTTNVTTVPLRSTSSPIITSSASRINHYFNNLLSH